MLDAGGGGGGYYGTTNWYAHDVDSMWALLSNQETRNHWRQVSGWDKIAELTSTHLYRLKEYRDNLAAAWPPEKSAAAKAFIDRLDYLINHVKSVNEVASTNYSTFSTATGTISTSRYQLKQVYDQYVQKKQQKQAYDEAAAFAQDSLLPGTALSTPRVTQADLDRLNSQARAIMYDLSGTLVQAQGQIKQPPPYKPPASTISQPGDDSSSSSSSGGPGPSIPPLVPIPTSFPPPAPPTSPTVPVGLVPAPTGPGMGPILGGTGPLPTPTLPPPTTAPPVITPTPPPSGFPPAIPTAPLLPGPGRGPTTTIPGLPSTNKPGFGPQSIPKAMPPGQVIGGKPTVGQPVSGMRPTQRINPVGGMIGHGQGAAPGRGAAGVPGQRPTIATSRSAQTLGGTGHGPVGGSGQRSGFAVSGQGVGGAARGKAARPRDEEANGQSWDPDNPWETDEGVAPVVLPPVEPGRIDPGPAIGSNR